MLYSTKPQTLLSICWINQEVVPEYRADINRASVIHYLRYMEKYVMIDPQIVYFTHAKISRSFSGCGSKIEETIGMITSGRLQLEHLPIITVLQCKDHFFSLNNRRLYVLKQLCNVGFLASSNNMVKVRLKVAICLLF